MKMTALGKAVLSLSLSALLCLFGSCSKESKKSSPSWTTSSTSTSSSTRSASESSDKKPSADNSSSTSTAKTETAEKPSASAKAKDSHKEIADCLDSYEKTIDKMEKASANDIASLMSLSQSALELSEKLGKFSGSENWTLDDASRLAKLTVRYAKAAEKLTSGAVNTANSAANALGGLGGFGF